ncbi:hypothetical protein ACROYT_G014242 [Oculina patagonica]
MSRLNLTGSHVLKDFWSKNGQWVGNHHNYKFGDLRKNTSHMICLEEICINPNAPDFAKPHPKQESIWHHQLDRVRQRQEYRRASDANATPAGSTAELFNDYAVIDRKNRSFLFGNLVRLVCASQTGQLEYKQPVSHYQKSGTFCAGGTTDQCLYYAFSLAWIKMAERELRKTKSVDYKALHSFSTADIYRRKQYCPRSKIFQVERLVSKRKSSKPHLPNWKQTLNNAKAIDDVQGSGKAATSLEKEACTCGLMLKQKGEEATGSCKSLRCSWAKTDQYLLLPTPVPNGDEDFTPEEDFVPNYSL